MPALSGLRPKPNRSPAKQVRFGEEEQRKERALTFEKSRSKQYRACSDVVPMAGLEPARIAPPHFECGASASFTTSACALTLYAMNS